MMHLRKFNGEVLVSYITLPIILMYVGIYGLFIADGWHFGPLDWTYFSILTPILLVDGIKTFFESLIPGKPYGNAKQDLSKITVIIPTKDGGKILSKTIKDLLKRFLPEQIVVASNGSTDQTVKLSRKLGVTVYDLSPLGKVGAINAVIKDVKTKYVLIIDDDVIVGDAILPTSLLDQGYTAVAFRVYPFVENWLSKIQFYEYRKSMDIGKIFHNRFGTVQTVSGAIGLFRTSDMVKQITSHNGEFSGEDLQRTLLLHLDRKNKGVVICNSIIHTDAPADIKTIFKQRSIGWNPGFYSNIGNYLKVMIRPNTPFPLKYDAFYNCVLVTGMDPIRLIMLPVVVFYPWYLFLMYVLYLGLESIPFLKLKPRTPVWILFIWPLYGLFNFITRVTAFAVFVYKRCCVAIDRSQEVEDYRKSPPLTRITAVSLSVVITIAVPGSAMALRASSFTNRTNHAISPIIEIKVTESPTPIISSFTLTADRGDSVWSLSSQAIEQYVEKYAIHSLDDREITRAEYLLSRNFSGKAIIEGYNYEFEENLIHRAITTADNGGADY